MNLQRRDVLCDGDFIYRNYSNISLDNQLLTTYNKYIVDKELRCVMAYSQAFSQAVAIVVYIAVKMNYENSSPFLATKYISEKLNIPMPTANKVLKNLVMAGILISKEGARGGLMLAKKPENITLLDIFIAIEQVRPLFKPVNEINITGADVEFYRDKINMSLLKTENAMKEQLGGITIQQLIQ